MDENKKRMTQTQKREIKFNALDLIIIALILFVVAVAVVLVVPRFSDSTIFGDEVKITYTVVFTNVSQDVYDKIMADDVVYESGSGKIVGVVAEIPESEHYYEFVISTDENGNEVAVKKQYDDQGMNLKVTISATAVYNEGTGYTVQGYRIASGKEMELRFNSFVGVGQCETITVIGEG